MQKEIKNILVPVNFSESSNNALQTAIAMCKRHGAKLHLVNVFETDLLLPMAGMQVPATGMITELYRSRLSNLQTLAQSTARHNDIKCEWHCDTGFIPNIICSKAEELGCDIIVTGSSRSSRLRNAFSGSINMRVLKNSKVPVLTVPRGRRVLDFKNILFPVRPIRSALDKLKNIAGIIKCNNADVMVLGIVNVQQGNKLGRVRHMVDIASGEILPAARRVHNKIKCGNNPGDEVLETGREKNMDLVVVTATLTSSMRQIFFTGYTQKLIDNSFMPVLFVKPAMGLD